MEQLLVNLYWITLLAVIVSSASGVLKAGFKKFDLFGVIIIAITTGLGGGSLRDLLLSRLDLFVALSRDLFKTELWQFDIKINS
jgi:uncharacterized membrane protein YeiH